MNRVQKKVLVTGGTGFIGKRLVQRLVSEGYHVINLGREKIEGVENIIVDLKNVDFSFLDSLKIDYAVHLAAFSSPGRSKNRDDEVMELNYRVTKRLFTKLLEKQIKKAIFMSSVAVYKDSTMPINENSPLDPERSIYGISKYKAESEIELLKEKGLPVVTFRLSNCYGPGQQWKNEEFPTLIPQVITSALKTGKMEIFDKNPVRDYIYVDDVVDAIIASFDIDYSGTLNLGTGIGISVEEIARKIKGFVDAEISYLSVKSEIPNEIVLDIEKTKRELGWFPRVSIDEGLRFTIDYYKKALENNPIKLVKSTFHNEEETKRKLCGFITKTNKLSMGDKCRQFEEEFAKYQGRKYSVLFNSGSSANLAIIQSLLNLKILKKDDKVGFSALTWSTNVAPLIQLGLKPIPIDVSLENLNVNSYNLNSALERDNLKALFLTNLLGFCGDIDKIKEICDERGITLIEDNCESLGSEFKEKNLGNFGIASTFSFFVGHHMSTIEGGAVCTDDEEVYRMLKMVRTHGWSRDLAPETAEKLRREYGIDDFFNKYSFYCPGYNLRPTEITGFIGLEQLNYIREIVAKRNQNFLKFQQTALENPYIAKTNFNHMSFISNFAYPLVFNNKQTFEEYKKDFEGSVEIRPVVSGSMVNQPFFKKYLEENGLNYSCPNAERIHSFGFYFPNNHELDEAEIKQLQNLMKRKEIHKDSGIYQENKINQKSVKKAIITGVTGQDGSYLAEFLLDKGYEVHGLVRRTSSFNRDRLKDIYSTSKKRHVNFTLHYGDMTDTSSLVKLIAEVKPDEIYNLAAQSHVGVSFDIPEYTASSDAIGVLKILEAVRKLGLSDTKFYQASTSELFGKAKEFPQTENTPFHPRSPYGVAKLYAHWIVKNYREAYNMFACNGILFNHESERRGENFVTRKITLGVAGIKLGKAEKIYLGNLDAKRDWGHARDYVKAMWMMLQRENPDDYVISTGESHSVREFVEESFKCVGITIRWEDSGLEEKGIDVDTGKILVEINPDYFRPAEVEYLVGNSTKARQELGWSPKIRFNQLVELMVESDLKYLSGKLD